MKKIIALLSVLCMLLSLTVCDKSAKEENITVADKEQYLSVPFGSLASSIKAKTDIFTAKVISKTKTPDNVSFQEILFDSETPVSYTVEVTDTFRDFSVTKGTKLTVIRLEQELTDTGYYSKGFETGKNYLIAGTVQLVNDKPVIVDTGAVSCCILEDKKLLPLSNQSEIYFKDIPTLEDFINDMDIKAALEEEPSVPTAFRAYANTFETAEKPSDTQLLDIIKQAISIDSELTLKITSAEYEMCYRNLYDPEDLQTYIDTMVLTKLGKSTDIFTGVVVSKTEKSVTKNDLTFEKDEKPIVYTVKIKNVFRSLSVEKDMTVNVVRLVKEADTMGNETLELEKGNTYFFTGNVDLIDEKPVIVDNDGLTCRVLEDGSITSISSKTDLIFDNIPDIGNLMNNNRLEDLKNFEQSVPSDFDFLKDEYETVSKVSEVIKEAIPVDSNKTIENPEKYKSDFK